MENPPNKRRARRSPFSGLYADKVYALLTDPNNDLPQWPDEKVQISYTSTRGPGAVRKTLRFVEILNGDGAFRPGWRGLDYGAGWGRIAALMLTKGDPEQLDLVDAWDKSMDLLEAGNFKNHRWQVSEILQPGDIPENTYNFAYAFSVFTHLAPRAFWPNLDALARSIKSPGTVYFTVRLPDFTDHIVKHKYPEKGEEIRAAIDSEGAWFAPLEDGPGEEAIFGTTIVSEERLRDELGNVDYLGQPEGQMQHVYALRV